MRLSRANKRDRNEKEIVRALESCGYAVYRLDQPLDLLVAKAGETWLIEVKGPQGRHTRGQRLFLETWPGKTATVTNAIEALAAVGADYSV